MVLFLEKAAFVISVLIESVKPINEVTISSLRINEESRSIHTIEESLNSIHLLDTSANVLMSDISFSLISPRKSLQQPIASSGEEKEKFLESWQENNRNEASSKPILDRFCFGNVLIYTIIQPLVKMLIYKY